VRNVFDRVLAGEAQFLDGMALANTCDITRRLYDNWGAYVDKVPVYLLNNPQKLLTPGNRDYYLEEMRRFRGWVEEIAHATVTDEKLRAAIVQHNDTRHLLHELYALRERDEPPLSGAEALDVCTAATVLPRDRANSLLRQLLDELPRASRPSSGPRLMVTGSVIDHPALLELVEEQGATVVVEDLCNTTRAFWQTVPDDADPLLALYRHHNERALCACMHPVGARLEHVLSLAQRYRVEGVINFTLKYCHPFLYEAPLLGRALEERGISTMTLEVGHDLSGHGQLRTRVQAFLEMLELA